MDFSRLNRREIWMKTPNNASNRVPFCLVDGKTAARGRQLRRFVSDAQLFCSRGWDRNQVDRRFFESQSFSVIPKCLSPELLPSFPYTFPLFGILFCSCNLAGATREKIFLFLFFNFHIFFEEMSILWTKSFFLGENFSVIPFSLFSRVAPEIHDHDDGSAASLFSWPTCCYYDYHHFYCY